MIQYKPKVAINLDKWEPPPWDEVKFCCAAGYPDEHKWDDGTTTVSSPMPLFVTELTSTISNGSREFTLSSSFDNPHGWFLSGMSGGPILATWRNRFTPIGLIFEGEPSSASSSSAWANPNGVLVRGLLLTPERFDTWLETLPAK